MQQLALDVQTSTQPTRTRKPRARRVKVAHVPVAIATRPLLFLDFDGVVAWAWPGRPAMERIRRPAVAILNSIIARTGCLVVVSSTWRLDPVTGIGFPAQQLEAWLAEAGFIGEVVGITGHLPGHGVRGREIQAWLVDNDVAPGTRFAILDDYEPMGALTHRLVRTDYDAALTEANADAAVRLLLAA